MLSLAGVGVAAIRLQRIAFGAMVLASFCREIRKLLISNLLANLRPPQVTESACSMRHDSVAAEPHRPRLVDLLLNKPGRKCRNALDMLSCSLFHLDR